MKTQEFVDTDLITPARGSNGQDSPASKGNARGSQSRVEIDARVEQARQQMLELRRQQEELERQRQDLEELRRREEEFESGKKEILEELSRTIATIEQEEFEINKKATVLGSFRQTYSDFVRQMQDIRESEWTSDELKTQLAKAVSVVDSARAELNKGRAQLSFLGQQGPIPLASEPVSKEEKRELPAAFDFALEFKRGLARNLPLLILLLLALLVFLGRK